MIYAKSNKNLSKPVGVKPNTGQQNEHLFWVERTLSLKFTEIWKKELGKLGYIRRPVDVFQNIEEYDEQQRNCKNNTQ